MIARSALSYAAVSGLCLMLHNGVMIWADHAGCVLPVAVGLSYLIVVVTGYVLHARFSFRQPVGTAAFARYALAMSANMPLALIITWLWREPAGLPMVFAAPLATICLLAINYGLSHWAIGRATMSEH